MLISGRVWWALNAAGVSLEETAPDAIALAHAEEPDDPTFFDVISLPHRPGPAEVSTLIAERAAQVTHAETDPFVRRMLLIAPQLSSAALRRLEEAGWSWIIDPPDGPVRAHLDIDAGPVSVLPEPAQPATPARRGRAPWGTLAIAKHLLTGEQLTQQQLSQSTHVGQPRASQILSTFHELGWISRARTRPVRWQVTDWESLANWWVKTNPGPGGVSTYWTGLDELGTQLRRALDVLDAARGADSDLPTPCVSGLAAADLYAPWSVPASGVIYTPAYANLSRAGFTPVPAQEATLVVTVPHDSRLWPTTTLTLWSSKLSANPPLPLADPFQVYVDVLRSGTLDADQAAGALRTRLAERAARTAAGLP